MKKIFYNGIVITMENERIEEAVLIECGMIKVVGKNEDVLALKDDKTELIDLKNHIMLPGFIDGHSHLAATAYDLLMVNLKPEPTGSVNSVDDLKQALKERLLEKKFTEDDWLIGTGYDNTSFKGRQEITKYDLDEVSKDIPIIVVHASGHVGVCNSLALEKLGYDEDHMTVEGGEVHCFPNTNELSGLIKEQALLNPKVQAKMVNISMEQLIEALKKAQNLYASFGFTTVQDGYTDEKTYPLLINAAQNNQLFLDVTSYLSFSLVDKIKNNSSHDYQNHYRIGGLKMFLDGSPQAKTAWLTKPYYIIPEGKKNDYTGFPIWSDEEVYSYCKMCLQNNITLHTHCNGDAAIDQLLRCYKKAQIDTKNIQDLRPVIIHAQTIRTDQLDEAKDMGMLISFFLDHVYYYGDYHYESVLGKERAEQISPARTALAKEINFTLHQDTPVVLPNSIFAIHNAVNRMTKNGRTLGESEKINVMDVLKALTINAAYQYFEEDTKGSIVSGKKADFVILDQNPFTINPKNLKDMTVLETIKDGESIYKK